VIPNIKFKCAYFINFADKCLLLRYCAYFAYFEKIFKISTLQISTDLKKKKENSNAISCTYLLYTTHNFLKRLYLKNMMAVFMYIDRILYTVYHILIVSQHNIICLYKML
jgi:hypothetical protein